MSDLNKNERFIQAYDQFADAIFRHCLIRTYNRERALDLTQETFTKSWEYLCKGGEIKNIRAFLYRVANNLIIDESRKKKASSLEELQEKGFDPAQEGADRFVSEIDMKKVLTYLSRLDDGHRTVVTMRYIDDLSLKEIAHILQESENTVSVRIHRALKKLKVITEESFFT